MIRTHEFLAACYARESFLACVGAEVSLQLIRSRESFTAEKPFAEERPLTSVPTKVRFEMTGFSIDFLTARNMAQMLSFAFFVGSHNC
jgi:hypothetical protein